MALLVVAAVAAAAVASAGCTRPNPRFERSAGDGAPDAEDAGPGAGCADGTREGFLDRSRYPSITACAGGWSVPGVLGTASQVASCGRRAGNHGGNPRGTGCSIADLCAPGWHDACRPERWVSAPAPCDDAIPPGSQPSVFYATRQRTLQDECTAMGQNNVHGCGGTLGPLSPPSCAPFTRRLGHIECRNSPPWACGDDPNVDERNEGAVVTKPGSEGGGALCCARTRIAPSAVPSPGFVLSHVNRINAAFPRGVRCRGEHQRQAKAESVLPRRDAEGDRGRGDPSGSLALLDRAEGVEGRAQGHPQYPVGGRNASR
jgi:hypothetical protein